MAYNSFFNQKVDTGLNGVHSWFGINLNIGVQYIAQICFAMFCNLAKIAHPADLEIYLYDMSFLLSYIDDIY